MPTIVQLGALKQYLKNQNLDNVTIANTLGVTPNYVSMLLSGNKNFGKKQAEIWSNHFGLSKSWLLTGEGEMLKDVSVQQTSYGDHSPNVNGDGNTIQTGASLERTLYEIAEYRKLLERTLAMIEKRDAQIEKRDAQIEKRDAQIDHLIALLEDKK